METKITVSTTELGIIVQALREFNISGNSRSTRSKKLHSKLSEELMQSSLRKIRNEKKQLT